MKGNGNFGYWITDKYGLPAYNYTCNQYIEQIAKTPTSYGFSVDHYHQIGNDRIVATVHNGGFIQVLESGRGFQWLTYNSKKKKKLGGGIAFFQWEDSEVGWSDLYNHKDIEKRFKVERIFGMGYFQKNLQLDHLEIVHNICVPYSDDPVFISEINVINKLNCNITKNLKIVDF
jgi:hypothetical protein